MSSPKRYVSLPVEIDAFQFDGTYENALSIIQWSSGAVDFIEEDLMKGVGLVKYLYIKTIEGTMKAKPTDYIIKGTQGEYYPCDVEVFNRKYKEIL